MKLFDCIKQLFSCEKFEEETAPTYKDDQEDQVIYYVPPFEESLKDNSENETPNNEGSERVVHLQKNIISTIEEFDTYLSRIENEDAKELITLFQLRLIESLVESGLDRIDDDKYFNCLRHVAVPFSIVPDGTPIREIKRNGIIRGNRVLLKAQVTV